MAAEKAFGICHLCEDLGLALELEVRVPARSAPGHAPGYQNVHGNTILSDQEMQMTQVCARGQ